jgi:gliding motility-associated-like protein
VLTLQPGNGYASYLWQDGSTDSSYIAGQPGKYWVAVSDGCHNTWRDTMEIIQDPVAPFDLGIDQHFCKHATVHFNVNGFQDYQWQGVGLNCNDCPDPVAQADVTGMYKLTARSAIGCYTSDSIRVFVHDTTLQQIYTVRCLGDQFTYNGVSIPAGSSQTFSYYSAWGCDSTIQVQVAMLPRSKDSTIYRLCPGQSVQVFGQTVDTPGVFVHHFKNWQGCDSLHTVRVKFYPPVSPSTELRTICPGDSTFVFGVPIKMAGTFQWHYTDQHGCDSIHIIKVVQFPAPQATFETRHICPGDSTMAYGNPIKAAGSYAFHFGSATGCDSVHIVQVVLYQAPQPTTELRHICAGDSTMVYSTAIHAAGSYSYHFSGYTGCDSVHTVQVMLYPAPQPTSELRQICPGDSTTVFGVFVKTNGTFAHHLSGYQGCDSVHAVQVKIYPVSPSTAETIHICPGDSVQVFGTAVGSAGKYTHHFAGYYGCDSLHVITVILYPGPQPTTESRHICPGDSTLVYGSYIKTAGNYLHHYANGTGCDSVHVISVSVFALPQPTGEVRSICPGDSTQVFGAFVQSAGDYVHHFLNGNGCDSVHTVHVTVYPAPVPDVASRTICPGDSILIFNQFIHAAGIYSQVFSNINGCDSVRTVTVTLFPEPQHTSVEKSICAGDSVLIFGQWRQQPGIFSRHFQNVNGCDSVHTITLAVHPLPQPVFAVQPPGCKETTGILNIQNPAGLVFSIDGVHVGQTTQFAGLLPGSYLLTTRDPNTGCTAFRDFTVTVPPPNQFVSDSLTICAGDSVQVFGEWKHVPGVFTHIFANQYNCDSVVTRTLLVLQQALYGIHVKQPTCLDTTGLLTINAITQGATFSLDNADFTASTIFDDLTPGQHWISARSPEGCVQSGTFLIRAVEHPWLQLPGDTMVELGQPVLILPQIYPPANYVYTWLPPDYLNCTDCPKPVSVPLHNVEYSLVITDSKGCTATDRIAIHVSEPDIYVPNVFSPNEDNQNEYFTIYSSSNGLKRILKLQIFDRWGNLLFERNDFPPNIDHLGWHGDFNGRAMDPGVFVWWAEVEYLNGRKVLLKGDVTLVK